MNQHRPIAECLRPELQLTHGAGGRILTNTGVWSADGEWIVYDTRSDAAGSVFDGERIEMVHRRTGEVRILYQCGADSLSSPGGRRGLGRGGPLAADSGLSLGRSPNQSGPLTPALSPSAGARESEAHCGVATFHPREDKVVFIHGPGHPTPDWSYGPSHRQGVMVDIASPGHAIALDARDLVPPFTSGALRGGSHVHVWDAAGGKLSFTYNDALIEPDLRDIAVSVMGRRVIVPKTHARNHDGEAFTVLVTRSTSKPRPGSDDFSRACEEGWVGTSGYIRADGTRQGSALAFQGQVLTEGEELITEVFIADLPDDLTSPGAGPLSGNASERPFPPRGVKVRRLTRTANRKFPGVQGPRHWLRSSPDGSRIAFLMKDDDGLVQLWTISPNGGDPVPLTNNEQSVGSAFSWSSDGKWIAHVLDGSVCVTEATTGITTRLTHNAGEAAAPRPEACVFSPEARRIAYVRRVRSPEAEANQIFAVELP